MQAKTCTIYILVILDGVRVTWDLAKLESRIENSGGHMGFDSGTTTKHAAVMLASVASTMDVTASTTDKCNAQCSGHCGCLTSRLNGLRGVWKWRWLSIDIG